MFKYLFDPFAYIPKSGIAGSHGNSVFNILEDCRTVFPSGCTIFLPTVHTSSSFSISLPTFFFFLFFKINILMNVEWLGEVHF